jgi:glycosyltransferase involved in cell wall biosynthesis
VAVERAEGVSVAARTRDLRVLCLSVYPVDGPSVRHRIATYAQAWRDAGVELTLKPFLTEALYRRRRRFGVLATCYKAAAFAYCTARLLLRLRSVGRYDIVIIHREAFPLGGAFFEREVGRRNPKLVYDLDDAIWVPMPLAVDQRDRFWDAGRVADTMAASRVVVVGNDYLRAYAVRHNRRVSVVPTPYPDLGGAVARVRRGDAAPTIVWIGNVGNEEYLELLRAPLERLAGEVPFVLRIIGSPDVARVRMRGVRIEPLVWNREREGEWLLEAAIGVMPLIDRDYEKGKCAFKIVQYFSAGLPVVASPVGMNAEVVRHGENGFLARTDDDWYTSLKTLLQDETARRRMGANGYALYRERFTVERGAQAWLEILRALAAEP